MKFIRKEIERGEPTNIKSFGIFFSKLVIKERNHASACCWQERKVRCFPVQEAFDRTSVSQ